MFLINHESCDGNIALFCICLSYIQEYNLKMYITK